MAEEPPPVSLLDPELLVVGALLAATSLDVERAPVEDEPEEGSAFEPFDPVVRSTEPSPRCEAGEGVSFPQATWGARASQSSQRDA